MFKVNFSKKLFVFLFIFFSISKTAIGFPIWLGVFEKGKQRIFLVLTRSKKVVWNIPYFRDCENIQISTKEICGVSPSVEILKDKKEIFDTFKSFIDAKNKCEIENGKINFVLQGGQRIVNNLLFQSKIIEKIVSDERYSGSCVKFFSRRTIDSVFGLGMGAKATVFQSRDVSDHMF